MTITYTHSCGARISSAVLAFAHLLVCGRTVGQARPLASWLR